MNCWRLLCLNCLSAVQEVDRLGKPSSRSVWLRGSLNRLPAVQGVDSRREEELVGDADPHISIAFRLFKRLIVRKSRVSTSSITLGLNCLSAVQEVDSAP